MVGGGQDTSGGWTPPVSPKDVVGTGHKWMEPVSLEGEHRGLDLQAVRGTPVVSPVNGVISGVANNPRGLGLQIEVKGQDGWGHRMAHLDQLYARPGMPVGAGQQIAAVGSTGASTGPHLDFRLATPGGQLVDPSPLFGPLARMPRADKPGRQVGSGQRGWQPPPPPPSWESYVPQEPTNFYRGEYPGRGRNWMNTQIGDPAHYTFGQPGSFYATEPEMALRYAVADVPPSGGGMDPAALYRVQVPAGAEGVMRRPFTGGGFEYRLSDALTTGRMPLFMGGLASLGPDISNIAMSFLTPEQRDDVNWAPNRAARGLWNWGVENLPMPESIRSAVPR